MKTLIIALALFNIIFGLFVASGEIGRWERSHDYPYGRMCDPNIFNLYHSTCPAR